MSITRACRDINELHRVAQEACRLFLEECEKEGVRIFITETYRSQARQNYLYEQGRTRPGKIVTWTRNSNHKSRLAWDIAVSPPADLYDVATLNKAGAIARRLGITWGGDWRPTVDRPHFEVKTSWKAPAKVVKQRVEETKNLQRLLNQVGFKLTVDGITGPATIGAVKTFQERANLVVDGIAGPKTISALNETIKRNSQPKKEKDEMAEKLPKTQQDDMKKLCKRAFDEKVFKVDHTPKVDTMTRGEAVDLMISYVSRTAK